MSTRRTRSAPRYHIASATARRQLELLARRPPAREIAGLYGLPSYAHFATRRRMVQNPKRFAAFSTKSKASSGNRAQGNRGAARVQGERLGKSSRGDAQPLGRFYWRSSSSAPATRRSGGLRPISDRRDGAWVFAVSGEMYGVRFVPAKSALWHPSVRYYDVIDGRTANS